MSMRTCWWRGVGAAELGLEDDGKGGANITITQVPYDRLFWDPHSRRLDFSDARYKGIVIWMAREQAYEMWPDAEDLDKRHVRDADQRIRRTGRMRSCGATASASVSASCNATGRSAISGGWRR